MTHAEQLPLIVDTNFNGLEPEAVARFKDFHGANPHVYAKLRELALHMVRIGRKRYGMKGLVEVVRWNINMETTGTEFRINNNYTAFYARLLMAREPELDGFFQTRESIADES